MDFTSFVDPIKDLPIAHAWRGHYSTIFLELGELQTGRARRDGSIGNARGDFTLHIEPNWRIEGIRSILCGSDDRAHGIDKALARLVGQTITSIEAIGRLPELEISTPSFTLKTFSAWKGQPNWTISHWRPGTAAYCRLGKIAFDGART